MFRRRKLPVGKSWRMDESYVKISGRWKYLYRAVDRSSISNSTLQAHSWLEIRQPFRPTPRWTRLVFDTHQDVV